MTEATEADLPLPCACGIQSSVDWRVLCATHLNVLLEGEESATDRVLRLLEPRLYEPVIWKRRDAALALPPGGVGALILQDVGVLTGEEQTALLAWLDATTGRTQIVSTTAHPVFPLIARGLFEPALYYRLNVMLLRVDGSILDEVAPRPAATT